jgi:hypothetical protein
VTPNRIAAAVAAVVFGVAGIWGAIASAALGLISDPGALLAGLLGTDLLLSLVHLAIAVALVVACIRGDRAARNANVAVGTLLLLLGLFGLFAVGTPANWFALNGVTNVLHFAGSTALLATGLGAPPVEDAGTGGRPAARAPLN